MLNPRLVSSPPGATTATGVPEAAHATILAIHRYWQSVTPADCALPGRQHIDPAQIKTLLPYIWIADVVGEPMRFRFRLIGTKLQTRGRQIKQGDFIDDFLEPSDKALVLGQFVEVVTSRQPLWYRGRGYLPAAKEVFELERVILPFAADGEAVNVLLGLTVYYTSTGTTL